MTTRKSKIVDKAKLWIGTPYRHQASQKLAGTDCLGLIRGVWREVFGEEPEQVPAYSMDWSEPQRNEVLWSAASRHLRPIDPVAATPGDVILFRMCETGIAKHLGILSCRGELPTFIHAYARHGVIESPLSKPWLRHVVAYFEFPTEDI